MLHLVTINIHVDANDHLDAAQRAWGLLSGDSSMLPVCEVTAESEENPTIIDLHEHAESAHH